MRSPCSRQSVVPKFRRSFLKQRSAFFEIASVPHGHGAGLASAHLHDEQHVAGQAGDEQRGAEQEVGAVLRAISMRGWGRDARARVVSGLA
jgi:hypothetical protein